MIIKLGTTIKELLAEKIISVRTYNICYSNKLYTVAEIKNYHDTNTYSFMNLRNCGKKSTLELSSVVERIQLKAVKIDKFESVSQIIKQTFIDEYELFVNDPSVDEDVVVLFQTKFPNPSALFNDSIYNTNNLLSEISGDGKTIYILREQLVYIICEIANQLVHKLPEGDEFAVNITNISMSLKDILKKNYFVDYCKYKLNKSRRQFLENEYAKLVDASSRIVQKIAKSYINSFYELIPLLSLTKDSFILKFGGKKKSALDYYNNIRNPFCQIFEKILYEDVDDSTLAISVYFPFLTKESMEWVKNFYNRNFYYPMFYIVCELLKNSNLRDYEMFCLRFGLNDSHRLYSLIEIAQEFNLTSERVRQILYKRALSKDTIASSPFWKRYFAQDLVIITETSACFKDICSTEKIPLTFEAFAEICNIIFKFQFSDEFECKFCCTKNQFSIIHTIFSKLEDLKKRKYSEDTTYKVCDIVSKQTLEIPGIKDAIFNIIIPELRIKTSDGSLCFIKNTVDIEKEAYDILYKKGEPMHIDELISIIKSDNVQFNLNEDTIRNKIRLSNKILSIGKTSMYKLPHWRNIFGGSIRDLLRKIMNERETPVNLEELTSLVTDIFENTNRNSINSNLLSSDEFVYFANGYYGLRSKNYPTKYQEGNPSKHRQTFEVRFKHFQEFVNNYLRIPYCSGADDEEALFRWYHNVLNSNIETTEEQLYRLKEFVKSNKGLPQNGKELRFKKLCQEYMDYVKDNYELPNNKSGKTLYNWIKKNFPIYMSFKDNRKLYFSNLIEELESYGYYIK